MDTYSAEPITLKHWSRRHARHLLNRAGFGVPEERVGYLARLAPETAVRELVHYGDIPVRRDPPDFLLTQDAYATFRAEARRMSPDERRARSMELQARERAAIALLQAWWFERMVSSPRSLEEKMTLFWHGHFATSAQKVRFSYLNWQLNDVFRRHATGNFKSLTIAVGQSPAMLRYLDNRQNVKAHPNENWARELMELFTMGQGQYTELDIKEAARAFTGWTSEAGRFAYDERRHDFGEKTFLGRRGKFDGWDILDIIFEQPATAEFLCAKLWRFFVEDEPPEGVVAALADTMRANGYEIAPVLERMFLSKAFYRDEVIGNQIKSPVQYLIQLAHDLALNPPPYQAMARLSGQLGQTLFAPPNVAGWEGGRAWINANTLLMRYNMSRTLAVADRVEPDAMMMMDMREMRRETRAQYRELFREALQTMPASQRREYRERMQTAGSGEAKLAVAQDAIVSAGVWDLRALFGALDFSTVGECVDALGQRYLATPLAPDQRRVLARALSPAGAAGTPLSAKTLTQDRMAAAMHLLFSMAEYQLC